MSDIILKNVTKLYGKTAALMDMSVTFRENTIYALLGRNGAGKSTMLNIITNRVPASHGEVFWGDKLLTENDEALRNIYCMSENNIFPENVTVMKTMEITKLFYPSFDTEYAYALSERFGLDKKKRLRSLSTGYASISKIVLALASGAQAIIFDEPVLGLDVNHREMFYSEMLTRYMDKPSTYIISTHLVEEAARLVERAVIIKNGRLVTDSTVEELMAGVYTVSGAKNDVEEYVKDKSRFGEASIGGLKTVYVRGECPASPPERLEIGKPELQQLFIHLTGEVES